MQNHLEKGKAGERMAAEFLSSNGFEVVERNYRHKKGEVDLIVKKGNWLIFVEVKTRSSDAFGHPEEFVDYEKVRHILDVAEYYIYKIDWQGNVRYDIVSIRLKKGPPEIVHLQDAFY